jgi:hypothetical protein
MKHFFPALLLVIITLTAMAAGEEPPALVSAVVRELTHDPNSPALEFRSVPGRQPPWWIVRLEILHVFRGDPKLQGQAVTTATADSQPEGNGRFVTPRLNEGDVGIWAIQQLTDGSWCEVRSPYEVGKETRLPLIKGRHDAYEKVFSRLSGGQSPEPTNDVIGHEPPSKPEPSANSSPSVQSPVPKKEPEAKPTATAASDEPTSSTPWSIIVVLIAAATGLLWLLVKQPKGK